MTAMPSLEKPLNILYVDDFLPDSTLGQGQPRSELLLSTMRKAGCKVTMCATNQGKIPPLQDFNDRHPGVTIIDCTDRGGLGSVLAKHVEPVDAILISRPTNMASFSSIRKTLPPALRNSKVLYDAEALYAMREIRQLQVRQGLQLTAEETDYILSKELQYLTQADAVVCVSESEAAIFRRHGTPTVHIVSYGTEQLHEVPTYENRTGFLMVGPVLGSETPNGDGLAWFLDNALPILLQGMGDNPGPVSHAGAILDAVLAKRMRGKIATLGRVPELHSLMMSARVFLAPIRYSSGIPLKMIEAAASGLPAVCTTNICEQLGWVAGCDCVVADTPSDFAAACRRLYESRELWSQISEAARARVSAEFSIDHFRNQLTELFKDVLELDLDFREASSSLPNNRR